MCVFTKIIWGLMTIIKTQFNQETWEIYILSKASKLSEGFSFVHKIFIIVNILI